MWRQHLPAANIGSALADLADISDPDHAAFGSARYDEVAVLLRITLRAVVTCYAPPRFVRTPRLFNASETPA